jgi:hypothetical protein
MLHDLVPSHLPLDVIGDNLQTIVPRDSPQSGHMMACYLGAMMDGSIQTTAGEGSS